jgi:hypothetical protein
MNKYLKTYFRNRSKSSYLPKDIENYEVKYLDYVDPSSFTDRTVYDFIYYNLHRTKSQILDKVIELILTNKEWQSKLGDRSLNIFIAIIKDPNSYPDTTIDSFIESLISNDNIDIFLKYVLELGDIPLTNKIIDMVKKSKNKQGS